MARGDLKIRCQLYEYLKYPVFYSGCCCGGVPIAAGEITQEAQGGQVWDCFVYLFDFCAQCDGGERATPQSTQAVRSSTRASHRQRQLPSAGIPQVLY